MQSMSKKIVMLGVLSIFFLMVGRSPWGREGLMGVGFPHTPILGNPESTTFHALIILALALFVIAWVVLAAFSTLVVILH